MEARVEHFLEHFLIVAKSDRGIILNRCSIVLPSSVFQIIDTEHKSLRKTGSLS